MSPLRSNAVKSNRGQGSTVCDTAPMPKALSKEPGRNTYRIYIGEESARQMAEICTTTELGQTELLTKIVRAGLQSIHEGGCAVTLPLRFHLAGNSRTKMP